MPFYNETPDYRTRGKLGMVHLPGLRCTDKGWEIRIGDMGEYGFFVRVKHRFGGEERHVNEYAVYAMNMGDEFRVYSFAEYEAEIQNTLDHEDVDRDQAIQHLESHRPHLTLPDGKMQTLQLWIDDAMMRWNALVLLFSPTINHG